MPETRAPTAPPGTAEPTAPVPKAALVSATVNALVTMLGVLCFAALITPMVDCVASVAWETAALLGLVVVWGRFLYRLCLRTALWVLRGR